MHSLSAIDEFDIRAAFEVLDDGVQGRISLEDLRTLYIGLGFEPMRMTLEELGGKLVANLVDVEKNGVSIDTALLVLSRVSISPRLARSEHNNMDTDAIITPTTLTV
jgi:hypothetical protein